MMKRLFTLILDSLFPLNCSFCGKYDFFSSKLSICKSCIRYRRIKEVPIIDSPHCQVCESILLQNVCEYCRSRNVFFSKLNYIRTKGDFEKEIIQKIKFGNAPFLSNYFRLGLKKLIPNFNNSNYSGIVNIPSNKNTLRKRPIPVCKSTTIFIQRKLRINSISPFRKVSKELQSGKSFRDRFLHAQTAFELKKKYRNSFNGNYLLVDDVFTTGATINEIAKMLLINGAKRVDIFVLVKGKL